MHSVVGIILNLLSTLLLVGIIIFVHELGHFIAAKRLKIKVERFSIGFGPKLVGFKKGDTEYRISCFPIFGGYVKMTGENPAEEPKEEEGQFPSAPVSHRAIVALSGPGMNMIFAVFAVALAYTIGLPPNLGTTIGYVEPGSPASKAGILPGDRIILIEGYKIKTWDDIRENIAMHPDEEVEIALLRKEGDSCVEEIKLYVTPEHLKGLAFSIDSEFQSDLDNKIISEGLKRKFEDNRISLSPDATVLVEEPSSNWLMTDKDKKYNIKKENNTLDVYRETDFGRIGVSPVSKPVIGDVKPGSEADKAGFQPGDIIEAVNKNKVEHIIEISDELQDALGKAVVLTVRRGEAHRIEIPLSWEFDEDGQPVSLIELKGLSFESEKPVPLNPVAAFKVAMPETIQMGGKIFQILKQLIIREVSVKYLAGPVRIVDITMEVVKTGMANIFRFAGLLSVNLGIVNLLPLFITDGGVIVFLIVEKLRGKPLSRKKQLIISQVGVGFIMFLFLLITYNDILQLIKGPF